MNQKNFYVAIKYHNDIFVPTIVEKFSNQADAESYAALMSRTKERQYIVLEPQTEWNGTPEEENA